MEKVIKLERDNKKVEKEKEKREKNGWENGEKVRNV
jgi:hypothetical protein